MQTLSVLHFLYLILCTSFCASLSLCHSHFLYFLPFLSPSPTHYFSLFFHSTSLSLIFSFYLYELCCFYPCLLLSLHLPLHLRLSLILFPFLSLLLLSFPFCLPPSLTSYPSYFHLLLYFLSVSLCLSTILSLNISLYPLSLTQLLSPLTLCDSYPFSYFPSNSITLPFSFSPRPLPVSLPLDFFPPSYSLALLSPNLTL